MAATFIPVTTTTPVATTPMQPSTMLDVVEPAAAPDNQWPPVQRPSNMVVPEEEPTVPPPLIEVQLRPSFWDPDSPVVPSLQPTRPAAPRWNPDSAVAPAGEVRASGPVAIWDPDSPVPPL